MYHLALEAATLIFSVSSHTSAFPPPPHPPPFTPPSSAFRALSLCRTCIYFPLFLTPSPFHTLQSLTSENGNGEGEKKKNFSCSVLVHSLSSLL